MGRETGISDREYIHGQFVCLEATLIAYFDKQFSAIRKCIENNRIVEMAGPPEEFEWKLRMRKEVDRVVKAYPNRFADFNILLKRIYTKMRNTYGVVLEQDVKEYKDLYKPDKEPSKLEVISCKEQYRSLFESILVNIEEEARTAKEKKAAIDESLMSKSRAEIIQPLIEARGDKSNYGCATYTAVKARMKKLGADFEAAEAAYRGREGIKRKVKSKELMDVDLGLKRKFIEAVTELLVEARNGGNHE
jgi:hypothetical protein